VKNISDAQQALVIQTVAKIPVPDARKPFLQKLEALLPAKGKVRDDCLIKAINASLASFKPGTYRGDAQGAYPSDTSTLTLNEAAALYQRMVREVGAWSWPPSPPPTAEQSKAMAAELAAMDPKEAADAYVLDALCGGDAEEFARRKAEEAKRRQAEELADATPWPLPAPPSTRAIFGSVNENEPEPEKPAPTNADLRAMMLADRREESDDERMTREINERLHRERLQRRHRGGAPKCFFR
jgi:hypothetical protein